MAYFPQQGFGLGSNTNEQAALDWVTIRTAGAADPTSILGPLKNWILSVTYSSNQWLVKFKPDFAFKDGTCFGVQIVQDAGGTFLAQNLGYNPTTQTLTVGFSAAATPGTPAAPPAAGTYNAVNIIARIVY